MPSTSNNNTPRDENPAAVFSPKEQLSVDAPVGFKQHSEGDLHLIDESLPAPDSVATLDSSRVIGQSPYPARADHKHSFSDGSATVPAFGWANMGFFKNTATSVGLSISGVGRHYWDATKAYAPASISIGGWSADADYGAIEGLYAYLLLGGSAPLDTNAYLRASDELRLGATGYVDRVTINGTTVTIVPSISCNALNTNGSTLTAGPINCGAISSGYITSTGGIHNQTRITDSPNNSRWDLQQLRLESSSGTTTGLAMWVSAAGIAPVLRCFSGNGESIDCGNNPGTAYAQFGANNFVTWSTERLKKEIVRARKSNSSALKLLKSATWDDIHPDAEIWPTARFTEVNDRWVARGKKPLTITESHTELGYHDCSTNIDCCGDGVTSFCGLHKRHHGRRGFVAEDVFEVFPEAVAQDNQNNINGIDYSVIVAEMWDIICELNERIESLEERLAAV